VRGEPAAGLCRLATQLRADLVVVGASARVGHRLLGSLGNRLVRSGRWPVVVVP
jgi:nucleotide-binding universal stress UspA family protein